MDKPTDDNGTSTPLSKMFDDMLNNNNIDIFDLTSETPEDNRNLQPEKKLWHPEKARMRLAYLVLTGIYSIFIITVVSYIAAHFGWIDISLSNSLFEFFKTGLLPIVTLILGFYFSKNS